MVALNSMQTPEMVALGWTLLHFCWQSTAIAIVYGVVDRCATRASASVRYGIAMLALALMPLAALVTFVEQARLVSPVQSNEQQFVVSQLGTMHTALVEQLPIAAPAVSNGELWIADHASMLLPFLDGVWLAGVVVLGLRAAGGWWQLRLLRRRAQAVIPQHLRASFDLLAARYRIRRRVVLRVSDEVISPMVFGVFRTVVLMPIGAALSLPPEQLEAVLAHELAHVRRWDYLCNLFQTSVECLFFFQPAVWWVSRRAREFREVCCDEVAAKACADPVIYAEALLTLEEQRTQPLRLAVALHGNGGTLLNRVRRVMGEKTMEQRSMSGMRMAAVGVVLMGLYAAPHIAHGMKSERETIAAPVNVKAGEAPVTGVDHAVYVAETAPMMKTQTAVIESIPEPTPGVLMSEPNPEPSPAPRPDPRPNPTPNPNINTHAHEAQAGSQQSGAEFLEKMRSAGYTLDLNRDLDQIIALRSVGVTPEYAKGMAQLGMGTPTLHDLVSLKSVGVTPEYAASLKGAGGPDNLRDLISYKSVGITPDYARAMSQTGLGSPTMHDLVTLKSMGIMPEYVASLKGSSLAPANLHDVVSVKSLGITPEYAKSIESLGLGKPTMRDVVSMKSLGITPEYVASLKSSGIAPADLHEAVSMKAVGVTPEYASGMAAAGFSGMSGHELVGMKAQGMTPEYAKWLKATFPDADSQTMRRATNFHIDADFIAKAKSNGFNTSSLDKLTKLKMSGLLN